ncbi:lysoplasmalogenase [Mesorhizobium amorphae]|uniref:lysoplasmalogenase n=1 Tax=Mesorhizobium amorphae TaxID=71433 RepID=UPI001183AD34|nr:lysoplasmalogenase [Mesorhizobium amorphae]
MMPFPGGIEATPNGTLIFSIVAAVLYAFAIDRPPSWKRSAAKTLAVALLAVLAYLQGGPVLLVAALVLSALGDAFLSQDGDKAFLGGLGSFLAAHLAYVALFVAAGGGLPALTGTPWHIVAALIMAVFALGMLRLLWPHIGSDLKVPVAVYVTAIFAMGVTALTTSNTLVIAGAVLFMASDALLAIEKFLAEAVERHRVWMRYAVWALYYLAQLAITLGFLLAA